MPIYRAEPNMNRSRTTVLGLAMILAATLICGLFASPAQAAARAYSLQKVTLASGKSVVLRWNPCQRDHLSGQPGWPAEGEAGGHAQADQDRLHLRRQHARHRWDQLVLLVRK